MHLADPVELLRELEERAPFDFVVHDMRSDGLTLDVDEDGSGRRTARRSPQRALFTDSGTLRADHRPAIRANVRSADEAASSEGTIAEAAIALGRDRAWH